MSSRQRTNIKLLVKLVKTATEALCILKDVNKTKQCPCADFRVHRRLAGEGADAEDEPKPERPTTSRNEKNIQKVKKLVHRDRRLTVRMLVEKL